MYTTTVQVPFSVSKSVWNLHDFLVEVARKIEEKEDRELITLMLGRKNEEEISSKELLSLIDTRLDESSY